METMFTRRQKLIQVINQLPDESFKELENFIESLCFKVDAPEPSSKTPIREKQRLSFLLNIAGLGTSEEMDISERDEEILTKELNSIHGWRLNANNTQ